ncbi:MAG TPA: carbohydrate kinase family protein [Gaiellaceae bacterium]|nr:carbohydrate kinase family protein [Gaiellaceae bacterium]
MHADVVVAGHTCLDVRPALDGPLDLEPGRLIRVGETVFAAGGAVANTGIALHRLGVPVRLVAKIGPDPFGDVVREALGAHGLGGDLLVAPSEATSYSIVIDPPGVDRSFLHYPGANDTFSADDVSDAAVAGARILHFGYPPLMQRMVAAGGAELELLLARARENGLVTSLDMCRVERGPVDWRAVLERVLPNVDIFCPSIDDLPFANDEPSTFAGELLAMGAAAVAIKLGERGLYLRTSGRVGDLCRKLGLDEAAWGDCEVSSPCFAVERVAGTTGAGDCTIAGLLAALLRGDDPAEVATAATAVGACCVEAPDGASGIPPWAEVEARVRSGWATCA